MNYLKRLFKLVLLFYVFSTNVASADDIGINSARLIQISDTSYLFEADFTRPVIMDYELPIFPAQFQLSSPEFDENAGWIIIKTIATTSGQSLDSEDEILLPWRRNGVSLTVKWLDGTIHKGLFLRSVDGIHVPLDMLFLGEKTSLQVARDSLNIGLRHMSFGFIHLLLIMALIFFLPTRQLFIALALYALGQASSMLLIEIGLPGFDILFVDLYILLLVITLTVSSLKNIKFSYLSQLLFMVGLLHGLAIGNELKLLVLPLESTLVAAFVCNITLDLIQFGSALILVPVIQVIKSSYKFYAISKYIVGTIAVFLVLGIFMNNVLTGQNDILIKETADFNNSFTSFANQNRSQATTRPQAALRMTNPVLSYISIEPFEIRHEILIKASTVMQMLNMPTKKITEIPIDSLALIEDRITALLTANISFQIEGRQAEPILSGADFVTLGMAGVIIRPEPVIESVENGIIGVSFVYETETLANNLTMNWELFPENLEKVDATTIDPFGGAVFVLTSDDPVLQWESTLSGYVVPQVEEVAIESPRLSLLSLGILIVALILLILIDKIGLKKYWAFILIAVGFMLYPFVRSPLDVEFINQWKPSNERSAGIISGLLTNVYRSFDYRNESDVYDRLAMSVMGDQLTQTYIEQRKGLEIENRGGAKAKVNDVEVLEVYNVQSGLGDDFGIEVGWKISGSVSHFGHMHYRQNRYRAIIWITPEDGNWKIQNIEMMDEERLM